MSKLLDRAAQLHEVPHHPTVLDFGCASGLKYRGFQATGADYDCADLTADFLYHPELRERFRPVAELSARGQIYDIVFYVGMP